MESNRWPMDFEALNKGDVIPIEQIERIVQAKKGTEKYALGALSLADAIMKAKAAMIEPVTCKYEKGTLVILNDGDASVYNNNAVRKGIRKIARGFRRMLYVDTSDFSLEEKDKHLRRLETNGKYLHAIKLVRRGKLNLPAYKRPTPGLPCT